MKIYIDLLFVLNIWIDFFLLLIVKLILRRVSKLKKLVLASIVGGLTTFIVFLNTSYIITSILKITLSSILVVISFGYKNILYTIKNMFYLFMVGVIFGGFAMLLKININYNYLYLISLIVLTPLLVLLFFKQNNNIKKQYNLYYQIEITFNQKTTTLCGFLDSGNNLRDPITKKPIILVYEKKLKGINKIRSPMYVPIKTINKNSLISCYKPDGIRINNKEYKNYLIGLSPNKIFLDGVDCLLNNRLLEDL